MPSIRVSIHIAMTRQTICREQLCYVIILTSTIFWLIVHFVSGADKSKIRDFHLILASSCRMTRHCGGVETVLSAHTAGDWKSANTLKWLILYSSWFSCTLLVCFCLTQWESCSFIKLLQLITLLKYASKDAYQSGGSYSKVLFGNHSVFSGLLCCR